MCAKKRTSKKEEGILPSKESRLMKKIKVGAEMKGQYYLSGPESHRLLMEIKRIEVVETERKAKKKKNVE